jgi:hypothetical protein
MVDMFVEGFLYALEMQEEGKKASSMEELSETLSEAANEAISEINKFNNINEAIGLATVGIAGARILLNTYVKKAKKIVTDLIYSDKYKDLKYTKKIKLDALHTDIANSIFPNIICSLEVTSKDDESEKFVKMLVGDINRRYKGLVRKVTYISKEINNKIYYIIGFRPKVSDSIL